LPTISSSRSANGLLRDRSTANLISSMMPIASILREKSTVNNNTAFPQPAC
jgi:hypothetical protein